MVPSQESLVLHSLIQGNFKTLLAWNYMVQAFDIKYESSASGPLPGMYKLWLVDQNVSGGHLSDSYGENLSKTIAWN